MASVTSAANPSESLYASLNAANSSLASKSSATAATNAASQQDRFLTLLVTQMKNQDPLNPMDNAQVTTQLAQISTVTGVDKLNTTLQALSASMAAAQSMQASSMIGHGVLAEGTGMALTNSQAIGGVQLSSAVDNLRVTIRDAAGATIRTLDMGAQKAGIVHVAWDGKMDSGAVAPDGGYTFAAEGMVSGNKTKPTTLAFGTVNSVTQATDGAMLDVGNLGSIALTKVKQIL